MTIPLDDAGAAWFLATFRFHIARWTFTSQRMLPTPPDRDVTELSTTVWNGILAGEYEDLDINNKFTRYLFMAAMLHALDNGKTEIKVEFLRGMVTTLIARDYADCDRRMNAVQQAWEDERERRARS